MNRNDRVCCFIQCRSTSTRFPGKCFAKLDELSLIEHVFARCHQAVGDFATVIFLIPVDDKPLEEFLLEKEFPYYKGDKLNVLNRYYSAARAYGASHIIRVTADCPVLDFMQMRYIVQYCLANNIDFGTNAGEGRWSVDGDDVEFMSRRALNFAHNKATSPAECEHVTQVLYKPGMRPTGWEQKRFQPTVNRSNEKTSIDTPEDLERVRKMIGV